MKHTRQTARKVLAFVLIAMQLLALATVGIQAEDIVISKMTVNKTDAATMKLDGKVTAGEAWDKVEWSTTSHTLGAIPMFANSGMSFKSMWTKTEDGAALWFLIDMKDPTLDATGRAWNQDNVRVYIDEDATCEDNVKVGINKEDYGSQYVSSEFMSYAPNGMSSKGFEYKTEKNADGSGYVVEMKYTFQNAALAIDGAKVRANVAAVFANAENVNAPVQAVWSRDSVKWTNGLNDKDYFSNAGELTLSDTTVAADPSVTAPTTSSMNISQTAADAMVLDGKNTAGEAWDLVDWSSDIHKLGALDIPADSGMNFKAMWTKTEEGAALWFLIDMKDPTLDATGRAWNQDNVRVYIDEDGVNEDNVKVGINKDDYGSQYVSSEFMSYAPNTMSSKGFEYKAEKKADNSGYIVEVKYTFQNAATAVAGAKVRANVAAVFANAENAGNPIQAVWSMDSEKWPNGLNDKDYFAHAGTITLTENSVEMWTAPTLDVKQTTVNSVNIDGKVTSEDIWDQVDWSDPAVCYNATGIATPNDPAYDATYANYGFKFKSLWAKESDTKAYLFFLVDVNDPHLTSEKRAWACDNIRLFIDETGIAPSETLAKRDREALYISSEFMSYATSENVTGFKYRCKKKDDGSGYILEVRYTLADPALAAAGNTMKLNVVGNDADSTNDDGNHFAQQFAWGHNVNIWSTLHQIDYIDHAGTLTLVEDLVKLEEQPTTPPVTTEQTPTTTEKVPTTTEKTPTTTEKVPATEEAPAATTEAPAAEEKKGCGASVGFAVLPVLAILGFAFTSRKKED